MTPQSHRIDGSLVTWETLKGTFANGGILIGNGASVAIWPGFEYASLYEIACDGDLEGHLNEDEIALFRQLGTKNFELVLSALNTSQVVLDALRQSSTLVQERYSQIRTALVASVHKVHVPWLAVVESTLDEINAELRNYQSVFSTNYDLLVYWSIMRDATSFRDFFWGPRFDLANTAIWGKCTKAYYLHGGLHLYKGMFGETIKRVAPEGLNLLDVFGTPFEPNTSPLLVAEGTAREKLQSIYMSDYLSFAYSALCRHKGPLVVFGHGWGDSDAHIATAIAASHATEVAVAMLPSEDPASIVRQKARVIEKLPDTKLHFFDGTTHPLGAGGLAAQATPA